MRRALLVVGIAVLAGCPPQTVEKLPPAGQFYWPSGIVHADTTLADGGVGEGILYVANANTDKRFDFGSLMAIDLSAVGLPAFGAPVGFNDAGAGGPLQLTDLKLGPGSMVLIAPYAGELAALPRPDAGALRLYFPTRSEGHRLYAVDAPLPAPGAAPRLECFVPIGGLAPTTSEDGGVVNCTPTGLSLVAEEKSETGIPRAPGPIGVSISASREVWISSLQQADTPRGSTLDTRAYLVRVDGDEPALLADLPREDGGIRPGSFVNIGAGATYGVVAGERYVYATGKVYSSNVPSNLVRAIDTRTFNVFTTFVENAVTVFEGRGAALSSTEDRLYLIGRVPDLLLVASITGKNSDTPNVRVERMVPLPEEPNQIATIPRPGKSDLVVITCTAAGVVVFYDDEVGSLTAQIPGVGLQPYGIAVDLRPGGGARLYVTNYTAGQVAVIDVPELSRPSSAKIVAYLSGNQLCLTRPANETSCDGGSP